MISLFKLLQPRSLLRQKTIASVNGTAASLYVPLATLSGHNHPPGCLLRPQRAAQGKRLKSDIWTRSSKTGHIETAQDEGILFLDSERKLASE